MVALATGSALALIAFADYAAIVGLGAVGLVVVLYFLGIFVGYCEDSIDDTESTVLMPEPSVRRRDVDAEAVADVDTISDVEAWVSRAQERNSHRQGRMKRHTDFVSGTFIRGRSSFFMVLRARSAN
jgi:hypothetical protein